jgi:mannose-6-phosphate isomerase-like protein (cupin superfamily)
MARTIAVEAQGLVRRLTVLAGKTSSASDHGVGSGHWVVMSGHGTALIGGRALDLSVGQSIATPGNAARNVHNTGDEVLELVEVQFVVSRDDVAPIRRVV